MKRTPLLLILLSSLLFLEAEKHEFAGVAEAGSYCPPNETNISYKCYRAQGSARKLGVYELAAQISIQP